MKSSPLVSVLVPTYNGARFLAAALESVQRQTHDNLEILVRDDGSVDDTGKIVESFCAGDDRFTYIPSGGRRLGGTGNMVELLNRASGEFVKYLHQDDVLAPNCVERLVRPLCFDDSLTMATSTRHRIDERGEVLPVTLIAYLPLREHNARLSGLDVVREMVTTLNNKLGEPSVALFRNGVVDPELAFVLDGVTYSYLNDIALWTNLLLAGDLSWHVQPLSSFRAHDDQRSAQLHESITVAGELACYARFGLTHGFACDDAAILEVARELSSYLARLHARASAASPAEQSALSPRLAEAVSRLHSLLEVRQSRLVGADPH